MVEHSLDAVLSISDWQPNDQFTFQILLAMDHAGVGDRIWGEFIGDEILKLELLDILNKVLFCLFFRKKLTAVLLQEVFVVPELPDTFLDDSHRDIRIFYMRLCEDLIILQEGG